ncbi:MULTISPECIES: epoxide hydrolase family protein [unclassified Microbacterium]|uniref:epoxide hydrolase family protein n=1 Tax=unclassified Microbacterium TaxID=2609290 RepID=UPI0012FA77D7|nr:epoxide hydrolase [Microbacterium sp. MAH-37]MVQ43154.1 epoxide hydrolase [Microbacterium sp. MAH-37]
MSSPRPFSIAVTEHELTDLRQRLERFRPLPDSPRRPPAGMSAEYLDELVATWRGWNWRGREAWLNGHSQFLVDIDDTTLHYVHLTSERPDAPALLVMHGWPHTFALQLDFADLLPDFDVVVPSLPGFGFSSAYADGPITEPRLAATMHALMTDVLGYRRYLTYGEDVTANVNDLIAATYPESVAGVLVTHAHFPTPDERRTLTAPEETAFFHRLDAWGGPNGAYGHVQGTRPDTLAAGLNDSPAGLLAWLTEKLVEWSDTPGGNPRALERRISRDRILTEAMVYWTTQSIGTSFRSYYEDENGGEGIPPVEVPASVHIQRHEWDYPESLARRFYRDLHTFERLEEGGHFAAAEVPDDMARRVRAFARDIGVL